MWKRMSDVIRRRNQHRLDHPMPSQFPVHLSLHKNFEIAKDYRFVKCFPVKTAFGSPVDSVCKHLEIVKNNINSHVPP